MTRVDTKPRCKYPGGCDLQPSFGFIGGKSERCRIHKLDGMVNVKHGKCTHPECTGRRVAVFGIPGNSATRCKAHIEIGMIDVCAKRCSEKGCDKQPSFGYIRNKAERCSEHRLADMMNVVSKRCPGPPTGGGCPSNAITQSMPGGFCSACDPDEGRRRKRKRTEERCFDELEKSYGLVPTTREMRVDYRCLTSSNASHCFVDGVFDYVNVRILLEIDEIAHSGYDRSCEERRMQDATAAMRLSGDERPIFWIRFNPDEPGGSKSGAAKKQRERCALAAAAIRSVASDPRDGVEYVNYG